MCEPQGSLSQETTSHVRSLEILLMKALCKLTNIIVNIFGMCIYKKGAVVVAVVRLCMQKERVILTLIRKTLISLSHEPQPQLVFAAFRAHMLSGNATSEHPTVLSSGNSV